MDAMPDWMWNEFQHVGADFSDISEVEEYDRKHGQFRDVDRENHETLAKLGLQKGAKILDVGSGTGHFVRAAARIGLNPVAVDISETMLAYSRKKAEAEGLGNIKFVNAGFLSLDFPKLTFDAVTSGAALHHLPDTWKAVALMNINRILKPGGQFMLRDVVFGWNGGNYVEFFSDSVDSLPDEIKLRMAGHIAREYSTLEWIMTGLIERAGFKVFDLQSPMPYFRVYYCRKILESFAT